MHELANETAYQFKVAEGDIVYVGDYTVDFSYTPTRITIGHTVERATRALAKYPQFGTKLTDISPTMTMPTGLPPRPMQMNNPVLNRLPPLLPTCPPACN